MLVQSRTEFVPIFNTQKVYINHFFFSKLLFLLAVTRAVARHLFAAVAALARHRHLHAAQRRRARARGGGAGGGGVISSGGGAGGSGVLSGAGSVTRQRARVTAVGADDGAALCARLAVGLAVSLATPHTHDTSHDAVIS